jgi:hypothetical protein
MLVAEPLAQGNKKVYVTSFIRLSDRGVASHSLFGDVSRTSHLFQTSPPAAAFGAVLLRTSTPDA